MPDATPPDPLVLAAGAVLLAAAGAAELAGLVAVEPPSRPTEDEPRLIGAETGATTCVPEPMALEPLVPEEAVAGCAAGVAAGAVELAVESPAKPSEVEPTEIGADTGATTWVPDRSPSCPLVVSAALAAVAPRAISPPAKHVPRRHLRIVEFMMIFS